MENRFIQKKFKIKYRQQWCEPCLEHEDIRTETTIHSDGTVTIRNYDHHGPNGHYRLVERASGSLPKADVKRLYLDLLNLVHHHDEQMVSMDDAMAEAIIEAPGIKVSIDFGVTDGKVNCSSLINAALDKIKLEWKSVI